jgi:hypothetical protein
MKTLTVQARIRSPEPKPMIAIPNISCNSRNYQEKVRRIQQYQQTQPGLYNRIMFWE